MKDRPKSKQTNTERKTGTKIARKNALCQKKDLIIETPIKMKPVFSKIFPSNDLKTIFKGLG